jgi:hypothetical protein
VAESKGRGSRVNATALAAAVGKDVAPPMPKPKFAPRRKVPEAPPPVRKTIVKKVPLDDEPKEATLPRRNRVRRSMSVA